MRSGNEFAFGVLGVQDPVQAQDSWEHGRAWWVSLGEFAPWLLLAITVALVVRALLRARRYRAVSVMGDAECEQVHEAIRQAEAHTVGEVVPVVVERADPHPGAAWVASLFGVILGSTLLVHVLPWGNPFQLLLIQLGLGATAFCLTRWLPDLTWVFIPRQRAEAVCQEQAFQEFYRLGMQKTEAATGVLIFVSLLEHQVVVLGDEGIDAAVSSETWDQVAEAALKQLAKGDVAGGMVAAVQAVGAVLQEHVPWEQGDRNELPDRLIVRRE